MKSGWKYVKLGELASYINGFAFKPSDWSESGKPIIRIQNLTDAFSSFHYCNRDDIPKKYIINKGDILISWSATLGIFEWLSGEALLNQHIFKVVFNKQPINKYFFKYAIHNSLDEMSKHTNGATMRHIRKGDFDNIQIPIPPLTEQGEIVAYLDKEFALIDALREKATQQLQATKDLFQTQLKQLLTPKQGWEEKKISDLTDAGTSISYGIVQPGLDIENGVPIVRPIDLKTTYISDTSSFKQTTQTVSDSYKRTMLNGREILMCVRGTTGIVSLTTKALEGCNVTRGIVPFHIYDNTLRKFVYYSILAPTASTFIQRFTKGAALKQINIADVKRIPISLPSLSEQEEIVRKLDALSEQCRQLEENYRQTISLCNDLKQAVLRQVFE